MDDIFSRLENLKKERNAVILAHYYQDPDIQDVADVMGDSLALAQHAVKTDADVILFCGVHFMCETAKILNPRKTVILPDMNAGCSLADSAPKEEFKRWVESYPDHIVISYINCSADVKAMSDIICTSSNAEKILNSLPKDEKIIFAPDKYLGSFLKEKTGRNLLLWNGSCQVHEIFSEKELVKLMTRHPLAEVLAHPECDENILRHAHHIGSTTSIINYGAKSNSNTFIIATEPGVIHQMEKANPRKTFVPLPSNDGCACNECPHMRLNTLEKMVSALENLTPEITMEEELRLKSLAPLERMLALS
ncbi:MAG: quinolinate synthase NadA [Candidatus Marinimicrobia bacterium]|jgi:quinolinate synthase|nr:quinolinate synthase NadA [Candidatus Neomarinimicrobiota bacterium]